MLMAVLLKNSLSCTNSWTSFAGNSPLDFRDRFMRRIRNRRLRYWPNFLTEWISCLGVDMRKNVLMVPVLKISMSSAGSSRRNKSMVLRYVVTDFESKLVHEEHEDGDLIPNESESSTLTSYGTESSFCEVSDTSEYLVEDSEFDSPTMLGESGQNGATFLEEMDEEELSQRLLVLSRTNKVRSALDLYISMELAGLHPNTRACNSLLSCLVRNGLFDDVLRVFKSMEAKDATSVHSYSLIFKVVAEAHGFDSSLKMFFQLERRCNARGVFDPVVYNTMISICGRMNEWLQCKKLWMSMKENGLKGTNVTYALLVSIFVRCGQYDLAVDVYLEMIHNGLKPGIDVSHAIIKACAKEGKWNLALSVFESILSEGHNPNLIACNALINSLGKAGEVRRAFKVYNTMKSFGHTPDAYTWNALMGTLYRANRPADALKLFENLSRQQGFQANLHIYNTALMSCSKLRSWDRALQLLWKMEASGLGVPCSSYNLVINTCEVARKPKVALQVYEHMIHQNCTPDTFTYLSLLRSCIWGSLWDKVEEILKVAPDVSLYNAAIQGMCLRGKIDAAKSLYKKMHERGFKPDGKTRALMLQSLPKCQ